MSKLILPDPQHYKKPAKIFVKRDDNVPGSVYLVQDPRGDVKVGLSRNHERRHKELQRQYGEKLKPLAVVWVCRMKDFEDLMLAKYEAINYHKPDHLSGHTEWHRAGYFKGIEMIISLYWESAKFNLFHSCRALVEFWRAAVDFWRTDSHIIFIGLFILSAFLVLIFS